MDIKDLLTGTEREVLYDVALANIREPEQQIAFFVRQAIEGEVDKLKAKSVEKAIKAAVKEKETEIQLEYDAKIERYNAEVAKRYSVVSERLNNYTEAVDSAVRDYFKVTATEKLDPNVLCNRLRSIPFSTEV